MRGLTVGVMWLVMVVTAQAESRTAEATWDIQEGCQRTWVHMIAQVATSIDGPVQWALLTVEKTEVCRGEVLLNAAGNGAVQVDVSKRLDRAQVVGQYDTIDGVTQQVVTFQAQVNWLNFKRHKVSMATIQLQGAGLNLQAETVQATITGGQ